MSQSKKPKPSSKAKPKKLQAPTRVLNQGDQPQYTEPTQQHTKRRMLTQVPKRSLLVRSHSTSSESESPSRVSHLLSDLPPLDSFIRGDAFEFLHSLPSESVDAIITDPPYESLELHRAKGTTTRLVGTWFRTIPNKELPRLFAEAFRVLKPNRHLYLFCDEFTADIIKEQQNITSARNPDGSRQCRSGFRYWREILWAKTTRDGAKIHSGMGYHYRTASERIMFFEKGKRRLNDLSIPDVLLAPRPESTGPAAKPVAILETLIKQSTSPGEIVLDPFAGTGSTGLAARSQGRHYLISDLDDSYLDGRLLTGDVSSASKHPRLSPKAALAILFSPNSTIEQSDREQLLRDLGLASPEGAQLLTEWANVRPIQRESLVRRHARLQSWAREVVKFPPTDHQGKLWRHWLSV